MLTQDPKKPGDPAKTELKVDGFTLADFYTDPEFAEALLKYAKAEFSPENVLFLKAVSEAEMEKDEKQQAILYQAIYNKYIRKGSPNEINLSGGEFNAIQACFSFNADGTTSGVNLADKVEKDGDGNTLKKLVTDDYETTVEVDRITQGARTAFKAAADAVGRLVGTDTIARFNGQGRLGNETSAQISKEFFEKRRLKQQHAQKKDAMGKVALDCIVAVDAHITKESQNNPKYKNSGEYNEAMKLIQTAYQFRTSLQTSDFVSPELEQQFLQVQQATNSFRSKATKARFQAHDFSKIKNLKKRNKAIREAREALAKKSPRVRSQVEEEYDKLLVSELAKPENEKSANRHFQAHKFSEIKDLTSREEAITQAIDEANDTEKTAENFKMNEDQFKIYKGLLDKELETIAKIRFQAFSKIKDLSEREDAIMQVRINDIGNPTKSPAKQAYRESLETEFIKTQNEKSANRHFQAHNFSELKDLGAREKAITAEIENADNTKKIKDMNEDTFLIYKDLLDKERQKTQKAQTELIKTQKAQNELSANTHFQAHNFSELKDLGAREKAITAEIENADNTKKIKDMNEDTFLIYKDLLDKERQKTQKAQKGIIYKLKSAAATFLSNKKPAEPTQDKRTPLLPKGAEASEQEAVEANPTKAPTPQTTPETPPPEQEPAEPSQDQSTASPKAPPPKPEASKPTTKPPRRTLNPRLAQRLTDLQGEEKELQATQQGPEKPVEPPFTTQQGAQSRPSIEELTKPPASRQDEGLKLGPHEPVGLKVKKRDKP